MEKVLTQLIQNPEGRKSQSLSAPLQLQLGIVIDILFTVVLVQSGKS